MRTSPTIEPAGERDGRPAARRSPLAKLLSALRGDRYMVGAYPPEWPPTTESPTKER
jgi:hypothetical protein